MLTYDFMEQMVVAGAFGMMLGMCIIGNAYWIVTFVRWVRKKWKDRKHPETEMDTQE